MGWRGAGLCRRGLGAVIAVVALLGPVASDAQADSIYAASTPDYSILLRVHGQHVFAVSAYWNVYCEYDVEGEHQTQESFSSTDWVRPKEFDRAGAHIYLAVDEPSPFEDHELVIEGDMHYTAIIGYLRSEASGEGLGGSCRSGGFGENRNHRVQFEAVRYAPVGTNTTIGTGPDRSPSHLYFAHDNQIEAYFWVDQEGAIEIEGSTRRVCTPRGRRDFFARTGSPDGFVKLSSRGEFLVRGSGLSLSGTVHPLALLGRIRERAVEHEHGKSRLLCWLGPEKGTRYRRFRATRYVLVPPREAPESEGEQGP